MDGCEPPVATPGSGEEGYSYGLTEREVLRLQDIVRRHCGVELSLQDAWARAIELVAFTRMLAEADLPDRVRR